MFAASTTRQPPARTATLLFALLLLCASAWGQAAAPLGARLAEIREINRFVPERALPMLLNIEAEARRAALPHKAEMLAEICSAHAWLGKYAAAQAYCEELIALGRGAKDPAIEVRGLLLMGHLRYTQNQLEASHIFVWDAERLVARLPHTPDNIELRLQASLSSAQAYAEEADFPRALVGAQRTLSYARQHGTVEHQALALEALAKFYTKVNELSKGFEAVEEAIALAANGSAGRLALLKSTEYGLAVAAGQLQRALKAQLEALALQRRIGSRASIPYSLVNLADCYLRLGDYRNALAYGHQTLTAARELRDEALEAAALMNIGLAEIASACCQGSPAARSRSMRALATARRRRKSVSSTGLPCSRRMRQDQSGSDTEKQALQPRQVEEPPQSPEGQGTQVFRAFIIKRVGCQLRGQQRCTVAHHPLTAVDNPGGLEQHRTVGVGGEAGPQQIKCLVFAAQQVCSPASQRKRVLEFR